MELTAKEWRKIWEHLYNGGEINMAGRISHDLGHVWNSDRWEEKVTLDFSSADCGKLKALAEDLGIWGRW